MMRKSWPEASGGVSVAGPRRSNFIGVPYSTHFSVFELNEVFKVRDENDLERLVEVRAIINRGSKPSFDTDFGNWDPGDPFEVEIKDVFWCDQKGRKMNVLAPTEIERYYSQILEQIYTIL